MTIQKKAISKTKNNTISTEKPANTPFFNCFDIFTLKERPISLNYVERIGQEFVKWAMTDEDALKVMPFFRKLGHCSDDIASWKERSPAFAKAYEEGKAIIGDRREIGSIRRKYDSSTINTSMPIYDREWKAQAEWKASLNKEKEQTEQPKIIVIERFPDSDK